MHEHIGNHWTLTALLTYLVVVTVSLSGTYMVAGMPGMAPSVSNAWSLAAVASGLNNSRPLKGSKKLVLGIAYKKKVDDMRESPAVVMMEMIKDRGRLVAYSDPQVPVFPKMRAHYFDSAVRR